MEFNNKKVLIIGGGQAQLDLIKTSKKMGIFTIVVGIDGNYPGYEIADKVYTVDIADKEKILEIARTESIDGICMACSDFGLQTLGYVCDTLQLKGLTEQSAVSSANKLIMKRRLRDADIYTSSFVLISKESNINDEIRELNFPLMVKAVDLQGSKGIYKCNTTKEVSVACSKTFELSKEDYCIVEEFIDGVEFGAQAFISDGEIIFIQPHGDLVWRHNDTSIPIGHYMPYAEADYELQYRITETVENAIKAMGYDNCAVNVDLILKNDIPYVIELTGRAGANFLPEVTGTYLGIDYYKMILLNALNMHPKEYFNINRHKERSFVMSRQLFSLKRGHVTDIAITTNQNIKISSIFIKNGDEVHEFNNSSDCIGKVLCIGKDYMECKSIIDKYIQKDLIIKIQ